VCGSVAYASGLRRMAQPRWLCYLGLDSCLPSVFGQVSPLTDTPALPSGSPHSPIPKTKDIPSPPSVLIRLICCESYPPKPKAQSLTLPPSSPGGGGRDKSLHSSYQLPATSNSQLATNNSQLETISVTFPSHPSIPLQTRDTRLSPFCSVTVPSHPLAQYQ